VAIAVRAPFAELDVVELVHPLDGFDSGVRGAIVSAWPEYDDYTVEVVDDRGRTLGLVSAHGADLREASEARERTVAIHHRHGIFDVVTLSEERIRASVRVTIGDLRASLRKRRAARRPRA
jgi:hypothetical protein